MGSNAGHPPAGPAVLPLSQLIVVGHRFLSGRWVTVRVIGPDEPADYRHYLADATGDFVAGSARRRPRLAACVFQLPTAPQARATRPARAGPMPAPCSGDRSADLISMPGPVSGPQPCPSRTDWRAIAPVM
jgi:hypothetical protein